MLDLTEKEAEIEKLRLKLLDLDPGKVANVDAANTLLALRGRRSLGRRPGPGVQLL